MLKIKFKKSLHSIEEGSIFDFGDKFSCITLVGDNGCGKSTLVNVLRSFRCNNKDKNIDESCRKVGYSTIKNYKDCVDVETSFDKIFYLGHQFDDPNSIMNASSAGSYIENGGYGMRNKSTGETADSLLYKFLIDNNNDITPGSLLILDEIDTGMSLKKQMSTIKLLLQISMVRCVHIICISHNELFMERFGDLYDFESREYINYKEYYKKVIESCE